MNPNYLPPKFFIIGERKCGTSSLYRYLIQHPNVLPCALKEPNFFGKGGSYVQNNIADYWKLFPKKDQIKDRVFSWPELNNKGILYHEDVIIPRVANRMYITGEASANTFFEVDPPLVHQYLPKIKLILLFRNPVERTFSHYRMYQRFQEEGRDLGFRVQDFSTEVNKEIALISNGKEGDYLTPSIYLPILKKWVQTFGRSAIQIYFTEDLKYSKKASHIMASIQQQLGLPYYKYGDFLTRRFNEAPTVTMPIDVHQKLSKFFKPYNIELFDYLGLPNQWD